MLDWLYLTLERYGTASAARLDRAGKRTPAWLIRRIARAKLVQTLRHVWKHNAYQRERWRDAGVRRSDLHSPAVLSGIPFLDAEELTTRPERFFCAAKREFTHIMTTSGTGGRQRKVYYTRDDIARQARLLGAALRQLPGASCVLVLMGSLEAVWGPGDMARLAAQEAGMLGLLVPTNKTMTEQIAYIREYNVDVIVGTPNWLNRVTLEAGDDFRSLGVKYIVLSSQPMPGGLRELLGEKWGATVIDLYATNESGCGIASQCPEPVEGLHVAENDFWIEIIDPDSGEPVPVGDEGEIVITTLSRRGMPLVRYRIGDLSRFLPESGRCACGLPLRKIAPIKGRVDHVLIIGSGFNVYPDEIDRAVFSVDGITDYQLTVEKDGFRDLLRLTVETAGATDYLEARLHEALLAIKYVHYCVEDRGDVLLGEVTAAPPGTLCAGRRKTVRIVDKRI